MLITRLMDPRNQLTPQLKCALCLTIAATMKEILHFLFWFRRGRCQIKPFASHMFLTGLLIPT